MPNLFAELLDLSPIAGAPIVEDENGDGCILTLPGSALNAGTYDVSLPIEAEVSDDGPHAHITVGDAQSEFIQGTGPHNFQLNVTGGNKIILRLIGVRVRLSQVSVEPSGA